MTDLQAALIAFEIGDLHQGGREPTARCQQHPGHLHQRREGRRGQDQGAQEQTAVEAAE